MPASVLGLDIGGANLKAAHTSGVARLAPFELWKNPVGLADALRHLIASLPQSELLAVTMTGELCDCFATKREGVLHIIEAVEAVGGKTPVWIWQTDGRFATTALARMAPLQAAAANWLALATYAGRLAPQGPALLIDIGSTTTDIVPVLDGKPVPRGRTDPERLRAKELVYTGVRRTPLCALLGSDAAAEFFATTLDAYLMLGDLPEDGSDHSTADGRAATIAAAHARLARMLCADSESCSEADARHLAQAVRSRQVQMLWNAVQQVTQTLPAPPTVAILSGSGEFLARAVLDMPLAPRAERHSLTQRLGAELSAGACAYAVAVLAAEQIDQEASKPFAPVVVKVGGSLFDLEELRGRLIRWLEKLPTAAVALVPGGGVLADAVRDLDKRHHLGDENAHWIALYSLSVSARFLASILPKAQVVADWRTCSEVWRAGKIPVIDPYAFAIGDDDRPESLPHSWQVTSDSLAARIANIMGASRLILLKSVGLKNDMDWEEAGRQQIVDPYFGRAVGKSLAVEVVNFREEKWTANPEMSGHDPCRLARQVKEFDG